MGVFYSNTNLTKIHSQAEYIGGFPIQIETEISLLVSFSFAIFIV